MNIPRSRDCELGIISRYHQSALINRFIGFIKLLLCLSALCSFMYSKSSSTMDRQTPPAKVKLIMLSIL